MQTSPRSATVLSVHLPKEATVGGVVRGYFLEAVVFILT